MRLSVIIPVYNEDRLPEVLDMVFDHIKNGEDEVVVVDDGSDNWCKEVIEFEMSKRGFRLVTLEKNYGKGRAVREGVRDAKGDVIIIQDGDLEYDFSEVRGMLNVYEEGGLQALYGSRRLKKSMYHKNVFFGLGNKMLTWVFNTMYDQEITDLTTCYKMVDRKLFHSLDLSSDGFEFCAELSVGIANKGVRIKEVPISYNSRGIEEGKKIKWFHGFAFIVQMLRYK